MKKQYVLLSILLLSLFFTTRVLADFDVYGPNDASVAIAPSGEKTNVKMKSEKVVLDIADGKDKEVDARVTATFTMYNDSDLDENISVYFPLTSGFYKENFEGDLDARAKISHFEVFNGKTNINTTNGFNEFSDDQAEKNNVVKKYPVKIWNQRFPARVDTIVTVKYIVKAFHPMTPFRFYNELSYVLSTGSGWRGVIGKGDVIFHFPFNISDGLMIDKTENDNLKSSIIGSDLIYSFSNLEPDFLDNITIHFYTPFIMNDIEMLKSTMNDRSVDDLMQLARLYGKILGTPVYQIPNAGEYRAKAIHTIAEKILITAREKKSIADVDKALDLYFPCYKDYDNYFFNLSKIVRIMIQYPEDYYNQEGFEEVFTRECDYKIFLLSRYDSEYVYSEDTENFIKNVRNAIALIHPNDKRLTDIDEYIVLMPQVKQSIAKATTTFKKSQKTDTKEFFDWLSNKRVMYFVSLLGFILLLSVGVMVKMIMRNIRHRKE